MAYRISKFEREKAAEYSYNSFGGGGPEKSGWLCLSFWAQLASQFLWSWVSWQIELGILSSVPSLSRTVLNFSSIWTIWEKSGLFSGCEVQHCSIRSRIGAGQLVGMAGLTFWKLENYGHHFFLFYEKKHYWRSVCITETSLYTAVIKMSWHIVSCAIQPLNLEQEIISSQWILYYHARKEMGIRLVPCQKQQKLLEKDSALHKVLSQKTFPIR